MRLPGAQTSACLRWLRSPNPPCPWDEMVIDIAAGRDIDTLQWLRAQDPPCPWGPTTCAAATRAGNMESLTWLRAQDPPCPWDEACFTACPPSMEILQWLHDNGCPLQPRSFTPDMSGGYWQPTVLQWLCDHGYRLSGDFLHCRSLVESH